MLVCETVYQDQSYRDYMCNIIWFTLLFAGLVPCWNEMEKPKAAPELSVFSTTDDSEDFFQLGRPEVSVNHEIHANRYHDKTPTFYKSPSTCGKVTQEWKRESSHIVQHLEGMQHRGSKERGFTSAWTDLQHHHLHGGLSRPAEIQERGARGECSCWSCGPDHSGGFEPSKRDPIRYLRKPLP